MTAFTAQRDLARASKEQPDPGDGAAITYTRWGQIISIVSGASGETNTLADPPAAGENLTLTMDTDGGGNRVITAATAINQAGNTIMTFGAVLDTVVLSSITDGAGGYRWHVISNDGVALS